MRLNAQRGFATYERGRFLALAARMIRRILVDHARTRDRVKRGGGRRPVTLVDPLAVTRGGQVDLLDLHAALVRHGASAPSFSIIVAAGPGQRERAIVVRRCADIRIVLMDRYAGVTPGKVACDPE